MNTLPLFWALALALLALTLAVLVWPLVRRRASEAPSEDSARAAVYRDQKRQLDDELATGVLSPADHAAAVSELTRRLGIELTGAASPLPASHERSAWIAALAAVSIIPVGAIVLYLVLGTPDALHETARARPSEAEILAMVDTLAARMKTNPGDSKGWRLLARSYVALGRYPEAIEAFRQAAQQGGEDADLLADWAEAVALSHDRVVTGEPETLAQRALALNPAQTVALSLLATAALERRDFDASIAYWRRVAANLPTGSEDAQQTAAAIAEVERLRATSGAAPPGDAPAPAGAPTAAAPPATRADQASTPAGAPAAQERAASVSGRIEIAPGLSDRVAAGDTLFVFARAPGGSRMPLAVSRSSAGALPRAFRLDDSMGMGAGPTLSGAASVIVEARISKSGDARPHAGDLVGKTLPIKPGAGDVRVVIDEVVP